MIIQYLLSFHCYDEYVWGKKKTDMACAMPGFLQFYLTCTKRMYFIVQNKMVYYMKEELDIIGIKKTVHLSIKHLYSNLV